MDHSLGVALGDATIQHGPTGSRTRQDGQGPSKIINRYQPGHKFLDQLLNKSPMCLVNEICRYHKLKSDYILLHTIGPEHAKIFCVSLQFGDIERFVGEGNSIRTAQRNAAASALQNTRLSFPRVPYSNNRGATSTNMSLLTQTPASELNTLLMKKGIQPKYKLTVERISNENANISTNMQYPKQNNLWQQQYHIPNAFSSQSFRPSHPNKVNNLDYKYPPISSSMINTAPFNSNLAFSQQYMYPAITCESFRTNQSQPVYMFQNSGPVPTHFNWFNSNLNCGFNPELFNLYQSLKPNQNFNKWNAFPNNVFSQVVPPNNTLLNNKICTNFEAKVEFDGNNFSGQGRTVQAARHSAANEALKFIKNQPKENGNNGKKIHSLASSSSENEDQSPVSLVYEIASRNRHRVLFELVSESGQAHVPFYQMRCSIYSGGSNVAYLSTVGEDRSKKAAKRATAENMLKAMKEKSMNCTARDSTVHNYKPRPLEETNQQKIVPIDHLPNEEANTNLCNSVSFVSCRYTTLLYQLTRNLLINTPSYHLSTINGDDQLSTSYIALFALLNLPSFKVHKAECVLVFEQRVPQQMTCMIKSVGFGMDQRMAKSISTYICLLKIGIQPKLIVNEHVMKSLQFSLAQNHNISEHVEASLTFNGQPTTSNLEFGRNSFDDNIEEPENMCNTELDNLSASIYTGIEQNLEFLIHILGKLYLFALKDPSKSIDRIFIKFETSLSAFFSNKYPEVSNEVIQMKCNSLKETMASLDATQYWSHLLLLSSLILNGIDQDQLPLTKEPLLQFKSHVFESETKQESNLSQQVSIISAHCSHFLLHKFKFSLIKKNFVSFGIGCNETKAREVASLWILKNLSYLAKKQMIENEFEEVVVTEPTKKCSLASPSQSSSINSSLQIRTSNQTTSKKSKSKASQGQVTSKQCISLLFQVCSDLNIRKPYFESRKWSPQDQSQSAVDLFFVECILCFNQEVPEQLVTRMSICAIAPNQRMARTICAYIVLHQLGLPSSIHSMELFSLDHFETYLQMSLRNNANLNNSFTLTNSIQPNINHRIEANVEEIGRNFEFLTHILQTIYRPFLKNHKMSCPSQLMGRVESELFEYHNQQQQIMDQSGTFDRCSANIHQCIRHLLQQFDGSQFWHHLKMMSSIVSLLTGNLSQTLNPPVLEFKCQICTSYPNCGSSINIASVPVAIVSVHSNLPSVKTSITVKPFLSFALSQNENIAREIASYKALRHLAINMWK